MNHASIPVIFVLASGLALVACDRSVSYSKDVWRILEANCIECHSGNGEGIVASGLDLGSYAGLMRGTRLGRVVVPGSSEASSLYLVVAHKTDPKIQMPPHHPESLAEGRGGALTEAEIETIRAWIDGGATND